LKNFYPYFKLLRPHQWVKNFLVAVPAVTTQSLNQDGVLPSILIAFVGFSLLSSSVYVMNDFVDRESDRSHVTKRFRPIASGSVNVPAALGLALALWVSAIWLSSLLGSEFLVSAISYFLASVLYTWVVKKVAIADVVLLSIMYTLRVLAGGLSINLHVSFWLLAFSFFFFLSLAFIKRSSELLILDVGEVLGRGYSRGDAGIIQALGVSSAMVSVLVFSLFLDSDAVRAVFTDPSILWVCVPVLVFWFARIWLKTQRGEVGEDPVLFAVKDLVSILVSLLLFGIFTIPGL